MAWPPGRGLGEAEAGTEGHPPPPPIPTPPPPSASPGSVPQGQLPAQHSVPDAPLQGAVFSRPSPSQRAMGGESKVKAPGFDPGVAVHVGEARRARSLVYRTRGPHAREAARAA